MPESAAPQLAYPSLQVLLNKLNSEIQEMQSIAAKHRYKLNKVRDAAQESRQNLAKILDEQQSLGIQ